jgi:hypothetical protein
MPLFQAGPYKWEVFIDPAYVDLGVVADAPKLTIQGHHQEIRGDNLGQIIQDAIYLGHTVSLSMIFQEWKPDNFKLWHPYGLTAPTLGATSPNDAAASIYDIGCPSTSALAKSMRATRLYNCPSQGGQQYIFYSVAMYPNTPIEYLMGSRLRNVPVKLLLLPYEISTGVFKYYGVT